ncbi:MAG: hypothetical protein ABFS35_21650, partial [Bacteroidota bacterium]
SSTTTGAGTTGNKLMLYGSLHLLMNQIDKMNKLYSNEWSQLGNYFYPTLKLIEKTRINSKYKRKYDKPKTPYQRLIESDAISDEIKSTLNAQYKILDPFKLKASVERKLKAIFKLVTVTQNVRLRL